MLETEPNVGVIVEGPFPRSLDVRGLEGIELIAVGLGELDAAIPVAVFHIGSAENDKAGFKLFLVDDERHLQPQSVQFPCREGGLSH
jgi:hypothetical protein